MKLVIVFGVTAEHNGGSLNGAFLPGPKSQKELPKILLTFRQRPIPTRADRIMASCLSY